MLGLGSHPAGTGPNGFERRRSWGVLNYDVAHLARVLLTHDSIEEDHESGGVPWSSVIESDGSSKDPEQNKTAWPIAQPSTAYLETDDEVAKESREPRAGATAGLE